MRIVAWQVLLLACLLASLVVTLPVVRAFDGSIDTNTSQSTSLNQQQLGATLTQLAPANNTQITQLISQLNSSTLSGNSNLTNSTLSNLRNLLSSEQSNNSQLASLLSQLNSSMLSGNTSQTASSFSNLKNLLGNMSSQQPNNTQLASLFSQFNSSSLSGNSNSTASAMSHLQSYLQSQNSTLFGDLVKSLQTSSNGTLAINPAQFESLLNFGANGLPSGIGGNLLQNIAGLSSLANLLSGVNPQLSQRLLNSAKDISLNSGLNMPSGSSSFGSLNGLKTPSLATPKLGASTTPFGNLETLLIPVIIIVACLVLFIMRGRLSELLRGQGMPGVVEDEIEPVPYDPTDPKKRIIYYFVNTILFMKKRGVSKAAADTHREFSAKCIPVSGSEHVSTISSLYEKAQFSGHTVTNEDANVAEKELSSLEETRVNAR